MDINRDAVAATPVKVASILSLGVLGILVIALFRLQIVKLEQYEGQAENNYVVNTAIKAPRGDIVDRNGLVIAGSRQAFSICGVPRSLLERPEEIVRLSGILGLEPGYVQSRLKEAAQSYRPTPLVRDVDFATLSMVEESFVDLPDVMVVSEPVRCYPRGVHFSHLVGCVGEITRQELGSGDDDYELGDFVGKSGIERSYEKLLRGRHGQRYVKFTPGQGTNPVRLRSHRAEAPTPGIKLVLYADDGLQLLAHNLLKGRRGCIIAVEVPSGGILALASSPAFDPNVFAAGISSQDWQRMIEDRGKPLLNRAIQSSYPPGSVFKIATMAMAMEEGVAGPGTRLQPCRGSYRFGNRTFSCWKEEGHGWVDLMEALEVSCDIYFYQLGERLDVDRLSSYARRWSLDQPTGIDLPGEISGLIPDRAYYDRTYGRRGWSTGVMLNLAIGQGELLLTPVQLLCFVCGIANGGYYNVPRCVHGAVQGDHVEWFGAQTLHLGMSQATVEAVRKGMWRVVQGSGGTGRGAALPGLEIGGKTGTAQNPHGEDHASFVCFAPYEDPQIGVFVLLENTGHGSTEAAPLAREMLLYYFGLDRTEEVAKSR